MRRRFLLLALLIWVAKSHAAGFDGRYVPLQGDLNGDGLTDLYLKWNPKIVPIAFDDLTIPISVSRKGVGDFVLQQTSSAGFAIVALSQQQILVVRSWPKANAAIEVAPGDLNYDGAPDLIVRGLNSIASGATPHFIFASTTNGAVPTAAVAMTPALRSFYKDVAKWALSPLVTVIEEVRNWSYIGYFPGNDPSVPSVCDFRNCTYFVDDPDDPGGWDPVDDPAQANVRHWWSYTSHDETVTKHSYTVTDPNADPFVAKLEKTMNAGSIVPGFDADVLQNILNIVYGGAGRMTVLQQPAAFLTSPPPPAEAMPSNLNDEWRWTQLMTRLYEVFWEVCRYEGEDAWSCWKDIVAPGYPWYTYCGLHRPYGVLGPLDYSITVQQRSLASSDQRKPFWVSRYQDSCDPFAPAALGVVDEKGLGLVTMKWLRAVANHKGLAINEQQLGLDIMDAHVVTTDGDGRGIPHLLSVSQISDYHIAVFKNHGLPDYTFGGAPLGVDSVGGGLLEILLGTLIWCPDCDRVPVRKLWPY